MAGMNPADYQGYIKSLNIKLPNMPPSTGAQPPASPTGVSASAGLTPGYMQQKPAAMPMSAPTTPSNANAPQYTPSQTSARDWINNPNSEQGGIDAYTARQNQRYADAYKTGDQDLLGRLQTDSQRVGYTLNMPQAAPVQAQTAVTPAQAPTAVPPAPSAPNTISTDAIKAEVEARLAQQRAGIKGAVDYTKTNLKNAYDYTRGLQNDQRVLEDGRFNDTNNPFSGATGYRASMMDRNRSIADTAQNKDYAANVSAADQRLADFDALAPEQKNALYDQLLRTERDYGLNVGQLTGNFNGDRTLAGSAQDANYTGMYGGQQTMQAQNQAFNQGIAEGQLTGQYNGQSTLAGKQANWNAYQDAVGMTGNLGSGPKADWSQLPSQTGAPSYQAQQAQYGQQQDDMQNEWKLSEQTGVISNKIADHYGIPRGTATQAAKQFAQSNSLATDKYHSDVDQSLFDSMNKSGQPAKGQTVSDISSNISRSLSALGDNVDISTPQGKQQIESMIISQTHDPLTAVPLYNMYGIPIPSQLKQEYEAALKKGTP